MTDTQHRTGVRRFAVAGARGVLGLFGIGVAIVSIAAATWLPLPVLGTGPSSMVVAPVASTQQRICAGPILRLGDESGQDATTAISVGAATVTSAATTGTPRLEDMDPTDNESNTPSQRLILDPAATGSAPGILAGSQSQYVDDNEYVGFAASECAKASSDNWLVGGSTVTGRTTLLALNNPSKVSSTVSVELFSESGAVDVSGMSGIIVPPGGQRILSLAGFAPGMASPVVHVVSTGGQVAASLQQSIIRTLTPGGVDVFGASTGPATLNVIPGVVVSSPESIDATGGIDGYGDAAPTLRVFVPGSGTTSLSVSAIAEDESVEPSTSTLSVDAGVVTDIPLGSFHAGTWTLTVTSEKPAVVAARTSTVTIAGSPQASIDAGTDPDVTATDFAWFVSAPELDGTALVSVAEGPNPVLHLANTGASDAQVTIDASRGADTTVTVPAGRTVALPVVGTLSYTLGGFASLRASVSYQGDGRLAGYVVSPSERLSQPVTVYYQFG